MSLLRYLMIALTYGGLGLGYLPGLRMNRATIAVTGAALLVACGVLDLKTAWAAVDYPTLIFLFGMMVLNANLAAAGFFQLALKAVLGRVHSPLGLIVVLTFSSGVLSALFLNDAVALILTPLVLGVTQALGLNPIPYLLALVGAANIGSMATLTGNPQNILIGSFSGLSYWTFAQALIPIALICLCVQVGLLLWLYPAVRSTQGSLKPQEMRFVLFEPLLVKSLLITAGLLVAFLVGVPTAQATLIAAGLLLLTRLKPERILKQVDWDLLLMFTGLFMVTEGVQKIVPLEIFEPLLQTPAALFSTTVLLSNLVSNVPAVLLIHKLIPQPNEQTWILLAAASTLAGNLTLLGSVVNLIVAEAAGKLGYRLTFQEHLRFGIPLTGITLLLAYVGIR